MNVIILSIFLSLILVLFFITLFLLYNRKDKSFSSSEQDALLPLQDDTDPTPLKKEKPHE
jgi:cbb3-type cytochrome oxidase subunit 3